MNTDWISLPAKQLGRCNDFIFTVDFDKFYFNDGSEYIEIKNITYLNDIKQAYARRIKQGA